MTSKLLVYLRIWGGRRKNKKDIPRVPAVCLLELLTDQVLCALSGTLKTRPVCARRKPRARMYTPIVSKINGLPQSLGGAADAKPLAALTPEFPDSSVCIMKERISSFFFSSLQRAIGTQGGSVLHAAC